MQHHDGRAIDEDSPNGEISSVGRELRTAREAMELTLEQLAGELRIEPRYLIALEEDRFDAFSAPVFAKGYLKQYAIRLGLDEKGVLTDYYRQVGKSEVPKLRSQSLRYSDDQQQAQWLVAGTAVVFVAAAASFWWFSTPETETPVVRQSTPEISEDEPQAPVTDAAESEQVAVVAPVLPEPVAELVEAPAELVSPTLQVEINFREDCWTEVIDARGERLFYGLGRAGARTRFTATPPLSFYLGNANGVELLVDENSYSIPAQSRQGNLARFVILESGD